MILYLIGLIYLFFMIDAISSKNISEKLFFLYPLLTLPLLYLTWSNQKFFTSLIIILTSVLFLIFKGSFEFKKFSMLSLIILVTSFYIFEYGIFDDSVTISFLLFSVALLIISSNINEWKLIISGFTIIVLSKSFNVNENIFATVFDYGVIFVPRMIFLSGLLFWAIFIPSSTMISKPKISLCIYSFNVFIPLFVILHLSQFISGLNLEPKFYEEINKLLLEKYNLFLFLIIFLPLGIMMRKTKIESYFLSVLSIQVSFILFFTNLMNDLPLYHFTTYFTILSLLVFMLMVLQIKKKLNNILIIITLFSFYYIPINSLLILSKFDLTALVITLIVVCIVYKSTKNMLSHKFFATNIG